MLKLFRFFIPAVLFFLFAFSYDANRKIVLAEDLSRGVAYTHADTARIDSIANDIETILADQKADRVVTKTFSCEYSNDSGAVNVFYQGKKIILVKVDECGTDHGSSDLSAAFINGKLACYIGTDYSWSFEEQRETDTVCCATFDQTNSSTTYFHNNKEIKTIASYEKVHNSWGETESSAETTYYFDDSGEPVDLKNIQLWIAFANSKKSYEEFFNH
jgi:hypothetical protein